MSILSIRDNYVYIVANLWVSMSILSIISMPWYPICTRTAPGMRQGKAAHSSFIGRTPSGPVPNRLPMILVKKSSLGVMSLEEITYSK